MPTLSDTEYNKLAKFLLDESGIAIALNKKYLFSSRLDKRLAELKLTTYEEYSKLLLSKNLNETQIFINLMTTNLSYFFREPHHFKSISTHFLSTKSRPYKIASFGCSTGEEPISLAISLIETGAQPGSFEIHASDIDTEILAQAKSGIFPKDKSSGLTPAILNKYFSPHATGIKVSDSVLKAIHFSRINLIKDLTLGSKTQYDAIMCRNALIYFTPETQKTIVSKFCTALKTDGLLCLGHAELLTDMNSCLQFTTQSTYIKKK